MRCTAPTAPPSSKRSPTGSTSMWRAGGRAACPASWRRPSPSRRAPAANASRGARRRRPRRRARHAPRARLRGGLDRARQQRRLPRPRDPGGAGRNRGHGLVARPHARGGQRTRADARRPRVPGGRALRGPARDLDLVRLGAGRARRASADRAGGRRAAARAGEHGLALGRRGGRRAACRAGRRARGPRAAARRVAMAGTTTLAGRVAVVTGASSGIGRAVAEQLAAAGVRVVLAARRAERLAEAVAVIRAAGGAAEAAVTDLRDEAQVERLIDGAVARHGRADALVNNAAVGHIRPVAAGRSEEWRAVLETNVLCTLHGCRPALRPMLPRGPGATLHLTAASAHEAWPYLAAYAASKAAVHTLSRALRAEVATQGIRVMTIEVHNVATEFASHFDPALLPLATERWKELGLLNPDAPLLAPDDVARAVAFQLAQPAHASVHHLTLRSRAN